MLKIQDVEMKFKSKAALRSIDLNICSGIYGLLGPNGSGKTTLMRCITGILKPTRGKIQAPSKIGYLPQKFGMYPQLTVYETLEYFASLKDIPRKQQHEMILDCLEKVHLTERVNDRMGTLSGGMIRRIGIAQALLGDPELILFDEPTAGLDPEERLRFHNLIAHIQKEKCVVISTHIVEDVESSCDHIILLCQGKIIVQGTAKELKRNINGSVYLVPLTCKDELCEPYTLLREDATAGTMRILSNTAQPGTQVEPSVEDSYISYIRGQE